MNSFIGISETQTTNLAVVAPGIAEALLATALGLVAAIPAVVIYNLFAALDRRLPRTACRRRGGGRAAGQPRPRPTTAGAEPLPGRRSSAVAGSLEPRRPATTSEEVHEINVTPFIDVMLVLLIIFMIAAPLATVDVPVDLPSSTATPQPRPSDPVYLTLRDDLALALGDATVPARVSAAALDRPRRAIARPASSSAPTRRSPMAS